MRSPSCPIPAVCVAVALIHATKLTAGILMPSLVSPKPIHSIQSMSNAIVSTSKEKGATSTADKPSTPPKDEDDDKVCFECCHVSSDVTFLCESLNWVADPLTELDRIWLRSATL